MTRSPDDPKAQSSLLSGATILFDLDGTAIDTAPDLILAANYTLRANGFEPVETQVIQPAVGIGARAMIDAALRERGHEPSEEDLTRLVEEFIAYYAEPVWIESREFAGLTPV